jgi:hypothetical protein
MTEDTAMNANNTKFYIDGEWVAPAAPKLFDVVNPGFRAIEK